MRFLLHYKDGVMVVPARADSDTVEKEAEAVEESGEEESEEEGSGEEGGEDMSGAEEAEGEDDVEEGESDGDPAEEFGSDLESEEDSEQEEEEDDFEEEEGGEGDMEHSGVSDKEEKKVCQSFCLVGACNLLAKGLTRWLLSMYMCSSVFYPVLQKLTDMRRAAAKELPYTFEGMHNYTRVPLYKNV